MMRRNATIFLFALAGLAIIWLVGARSAQGAVPRDLWLEFGSAPGDSINYIAHWTMPTVGPDQRPIAGYEAQIVLNGQTVLASATTAQVQVTLSIARPAVGATLGPLTLRVRSRDTAGTTSEWASTVPWTVTHEALPPSPPATVTVDSGSIALDSIIIRPQVVVMNKGAHIQMCPIIFPTRGVPGLPLEYSSKPECVAAYEAWVASHQITA